MGITGLLGVLKSIQKHTHLRQYAGQTIGVDAYGWLHRGTVACAREIALDKPCTKHVEFAMHRVRMLIYFGVTPYLVFDGDNLPSKEATENQRAKRREESKIRGLELFKAGKCSQAHPEFQKAVDVTPYMARQLIDELKKLNVQYVVAPYEADAQLAYLEKKGIIDGILSEDSDLLVYGAKLLITKLDQYGECIAISRSEFASCRDMSLAGFTDANFRLMAILSGCDYLASINKIGLKTAHAYVRKYKNVEKILRMLQFEQKFVVPNDYLEKFYEAERTFLHHRVFCPLKKRLVFSNELEAGMKEEDMPYLGKDVSPVTAIAVACGDLDPMTKKAIVVVGAKTSRSTPDLHRKPPPARETDLKPAKSIDSFFKAKRQPLAELDPNSLTPSPSQQRLLDIHRDTTWAARPASSAPQLSRSTVFIPTGPADTRQSSERASFLERAATLSTFQPSKRTRLCSDADFSPSRKETSSPFFAAQPEPSPLVRKRGKTKRARRSDLEIFSDDSIADSNPLDSSAVGVPQSTHSENEASRSAIVLSDEAVTEVCDTPTRQKIIVQEANGDLEGCDERSEGPVEAKAMKALQSTFAYQSPKLQAAALRGLTPPVDAPQHSRKEKLKNWETPTQDVSVSPSLDLRERIASGKTSYKTFSRKSAAQQATAFKSLGQRQSAAQKVRLGLVAMVSATQPDRQQPCLTPLEQVGEGDIGDLREQPAPPLSGRRSSAATTIGSPVGQLLKPDVRGSEDFLVARSEDEESELSVIDGATAVKPSIDLTRFAFTARA